MCSSGLPQAVLDPVEAPEADPSAAGLEHIYDAEGMAQYVDHFYKAAGKATYVETKGRSDYVTLVSPRLQVLCLAHSGNALLRFSLLKATAQLDLWPFLGSHTSFLPM